MNKNLKLLLFILLTILFAIYLIQLNRYPFMGIYVSENEQGNINVEELRDLGWGWNNGIKQGDIIKLIDGEQPEYNANVNKYGRIEQVQTLTVNQSGVENTFSVDYSSGTTQQVLIYILIPILFFLFSLLLSITLFRNYMNNSSKILIFLMLLLGLGYIASSLSLKLFPAGLITVDFTLLIIPILFLHFIYYYMKGKGISLFSIKSVYILYIFAMSIFTVVTFDLILLPIKQVLLFSFVGLVLITGGLLIKGFLVIKNTYLQETYSWILRSLLIAIAPYTFLYVIPNLIFGVTLIRPEIALVFVYIVPVILLYLLTTGKLYLIKIHIKRMNYYIMLSFIFTVVICGLYILLIRDKIQFSILALFFIFTFLFTICSFYFKNYLDRRLRTSLFVEKDYYQKSLYRFSESLKDERSSDGILRVFQRELEDVLSAVNVVFHQIDRNDEKIKLDRSYQESFKKLKKKQLRIGKIIQSEGQFVITVGETDQYFTVCFGSLSNERVLNVDELDWLSALAYYSSVSLENMMEIEDLLSQLKNTQSSQPNWVNRLIFNWSEDERRRLAADIHDSFLQDVIILKRRISDLNLDDQVLEMEQELEDIIFSIRETCQELAPPLLSELGLSASLSELIHKANLRSNIHFSININPDFRELSIPLDYKQMIYRTIQELINNAIKHSQAKVATVKLKVANDQVELEYQDNGVGMDPETKEKPVSGMGLLGMQERIRSFNGLIYFDSKQNKGLKVTAKVPINDA